MFQSQYIESSPRVSEDEGTPKKYKICTKSHSKNFGSPISRKAHSYLFSSASTEDSFEAMKRDSETEKSTFFLNSEVQRLTSINCKLIKENEALKEQLENARQSDLENKVALLVAENDRLSKMNDQQPTSNTSNDDEYVEVCIEELMEDLKTWKEKYSVLELKSKNEITELQNKVKLLEADNSYLANQNLLKDSEINRLKLLTGEKSNIEITETYEREAETWKAKNQELELALRNLRDQFSLLNGEYKMIADENERYLIVTHVLFGDYKRMHQTIAKQNAEIAETAKLIEDLQQKLVALSKEHQRNLEALTEKTDENESLQSQLRHKEDQELAMQLNEIKNRMSALHKENENLNGMINEKKFDVDVIKRRIEELERAYNENDLLKQNLVIMIQENERLQVFIKDKLKENEELKAKNVELEENLHLIQELNNKIQELIDETNRLNQQEENLVIGVKTLEALMAPYQAKSIKSEKTLS